MDFSFSDDQLMFAEAVRDLLANQCTPAVVRAAWENDTGRTEGLWDALAEMGVVGMTAPEPAGGLGMDETDMVLLLEEAGRAALPEPLLEHTAVGVPTLADAGGPVAEAWLGRAAAGEATLGAAPDGGFAVGAAECDLVLVIGDRVRAVEVAGASLVEHRSIDGSRRLFELGDGAVEKGAGQKGAGQKGAAKKGAGSKGAGAEGAVEIDADPALAFDRAAAAAAALCVGVAQHLLDATVDYVAQRHQFGKPVGSYQAVKHHLANTALKIEFARPAAHHAAWCIATGDPDRSRDVSLAKALASEAADVAARTALQCHGAIGYTFEYDLHLWMKRGWALSAAWGDAAWHRNRIAAALGI